MLLIGDVNSGKTSFMNYCLSLNEDNTSDKSFLQFFQPSKKGNISNSNIELEYFERNDEVILENDDDIQCFYFVKVQQEIKRITSLKSSKKIKIKIQRPFLKYFNIIECCNLDSIEKLIRFNFAYTVYFKDLSFTEAITSNVIKVFNDITNKFIPLSIIFSKNDLATRILKEDYLDDNCEDDDEENKEKRLKQQKLERVQKVKSENLDYLSLHVDIRQNLEFDLKIQNNENSMKNEKIIIDFLKTLQSFILNEDHLILKQNIIRCNLVGAMDSLQSKSQEFNFTLGNKLSLMAELSEHEETKTKSINQLLTFFENSNEIENNFLDFVISEQKKYCCNPFYNNEQMLKDSLGFFAEKLNEIEESEEADLRKKLENLFRFPVYLPKFKTDSTKLFKILRDVTLNSYKKYKEEVLETFPTILNESIKKDFQEIRDLINN